MALQSKKRTPARNGMRPRPQKRRSEPEVIVQLQGQRPKLMDADEANDAEPVSQVRPAWPGTGAIQQIFWEAQRLAK